MNIKKNNSNLTANAISKIMNRSASSIRKYLRQGVIVGWCNYNPKEEIKISGRLNGKNNGEKANKKIEIIKDNIVLGKFKSASELQRKSEVLFGKKLLVTKISEVCLGKLKQYKGFTFKYIEDSTLEKLHNQELVQAC